MQIRKENKEPLRGLSLQSVEVDGGVEPGAFWGFSAGLLRFTYHDKEILSAFTYGFSINAVTRPLHSRLVISRSEVGTLRSVAHGCAVHVRKLSLRLASNSTFSRTF